MSDLPRMILRDATCWVDRVSQLGQMSEATIPLPKVKTDDMRNAGMIKARDVSMGFELDKLALKFTSFDPQVMAMSGLKPGVEKEYMITGAHVDETGVTHSTVCYIRGRMMEPNADAWTPGEKSENDFSIAIDYMKIEQDGTPIYEIDDFDYKVKGVSQIGDIRNALLL